MPEDRILRVSTLVSTLCFLTWEYDELRAVLRRFLHERSSLLSGLSCVEKNWRYVTSSYSRLGKKHWCASRTAVSLITLYHVPPPFDHSATRTDLNVAQNMEHMGLLS